MEKTVAIRIFSGSFIAILQSIFDPESKIKATGNFWKAVQEMQKQLKQQGYAVEGEIPKTVKKKVQVHANYNRSTDSTPFRPKGLKVII